MLRCYRKLMLLPGLLCFFWITANSQNPEKQGWTRLFNGKDLAGWEVKIAGHPLGDNYKSTFRAENGILRVDYSKYVSFGDSFGHLFYKQPFSYYILRFQYRFTGQQVKGGPEWGVRSSGVLVHAQSPQSMTRNQDYPFSLEVQLLGGLGKGERHTANACTNGTQVQIRGTLSPAHCVQSASKTFDGDQWVQASVVVLGDSVVKHIVEGDTVISYEKPQIGVGMVDKELHVDASAHSYWVSQEGKPLEEGFIAIQSKSHPVEFRNIEILNLKGCTDRKAKNYRTYYVKTDNTLCRY